MARSIGHPQAALTNYSNRPGEWYVGGDVVVVVGGSSIAVQVSCGHCSGHDAQETPNVELIPRGKIRLYFVQ